MKKAMYAFSGDPITYGHIDIIKRASKVFDLIVGIGVNPDKEYMFNLSEREEMAKQCFPNVKVVSFKGLLVDYAYEHGVDVIVKGVRNRADFDYENILHQMGESQKLGIDSHILFAKPSLAHMSSSVVKKIQKEQGLTHEYVPLYVKQLLEKRMSGQFIVGVTGEIGVGKSYLCEKFVSLGKAKGIEVHHIELDAIGHQILEELDEPKYKEIREEVVSVFGSEVKKEDGTIDRKKLGEIVFSDMGSLEKLNKIMYTPLLVRLRRELYGKKGLILFNAALIAESSMHYLCNNNVILVNCDKETQEKRLNSRELNSEQIERRVKSQFSFEKKKEILEKAIEKDNCGKLWVVKGSGEGVEGVFESVVGKDWKSMKNIEIELKFPLLNPKELTEKLKSIAKLKKENDFQKDTYYNPAHRNFLNKKPISEWLRLRETGKSFFINYKNWHNEENVAISCDEYETKIEDVEVLKNILESLNFKEIITVEKTRSTWHYKDTEIAIDNVKDLGNFIEIEANGNFENIEEAKKHLYEILKELNTELGEQDFEGYPYLLLKGKII